MAKSAKGKRKIAKEVAKAETAKSENAEAVKTQPAPATKAAPVETPAPQKNDTQPVLAETPKNVSITDRIIRFTKSNVSLFTVAVALLMGFMFYLRAVPSHDLVFTNWAGNYVNVAADDGVMHMRLLFNTIAHYPFRIMYDPFTHFPYGSPIHFGPLYELIPATIAIILGLGSPSNQLITTVAAYFPCVLGALCIIPTYYIGKRLFGRGAGLMAAITLAFLPGSFFWRSILGETDHHVAEVLFAACTIAFLTYTIYEAKKSGLTLDQIKKKDFKAIKVPLIFAALSGIFYGFYMLSWVGALMMGFVLITYFTIQAIIDHLQGKTLDYLLVTAAFTFGIPAVMVLPYSLQSFSMQMGSYTIAQPIILCIGIIGVGVIYAISQILNKNKVEKIMFPVTIAGIGVIGLLLVYIFVPSLYGIVVWGLNVFFPNGGILTVEEVAPTYIDRNTGEFTLSALWAHFQWVFPIAIIALVMLLIREIKKPRAHELLFLVWTFIMGWAFMSQNRFTYYFAINASLLMGFFAYELFKALDMEKLKDAFIKKVKSVDDLSRFVNKNLGGCVIAVLVVLALLLVAVYPALPISDPYGTNKEGILLQASKSGPPTMSYEWYEALYWMKGHTPDPQGNPIAANYNYASGQYTQPAEGQRYDNPASAYGVMSWWDYGHDIEYVANRAPNANPFQAGIIEENNTAGPSYFFTSQNETSAYENLNKLGSRYIAIDNQMATGKFYAIAKWINDTDGWLGGANVDLGNGNKYSIGFDSPKYLNSTMYKLYYRDGNGTSHFRLVHDSAGDYTITFKYADVTTGAEYPYASRTLSNYTDAVALYQQAIQPAWLTTNKDFVWDARPPEKGVKLFEKVKGATITGSAPDGVKVNVSVTLKSGDRQFTYVNSAVAQNGTYSITVPYPTDAMKGDGYEYDVTPVSKYTIEYGGTTKTVDVPESAVMKGGTVQVT